MNLLKEIKEWLDLIYNDRIDNFNGAKQLIEKEFKNKNLTDDEKTHLEYLKIAIRQYSK